LEEARAIVAPFYQALNQPAKRDIQALVDQSTTPNFQSCGNEGECIGREALVVRWMGLGKTIPDLSWTVRDLWVAGDDVIVRGEATGTPAEAFLGQQPTGRSFRTMSIDVHTIRDGKIAHTYHVENWTAALRQLNGS
jgi:predicted ester cyclase